jgi:hypothetical protein
MTLTGMTVSVHSVIHDGRRSNETLQINKMLEPAYQSIGSWEGNHRELNYKICTAIDLTKVSIVIRKLVEEGMEPELAKIFETQAEVLLAALRSENNRLKLTNQVLGGKINVR